MTVVATGAAKTGCRFRNFRAGSSDVTEARDPSRIVLPLDSDEALNANSFLIAANPNPKLKGKHETQSYDNQFDLLGSIDFPDGV
jgi:hypothetical protein